MSMNMKEESQLAGSPRRAASIPPARWRRPCACCAERNLMRSAGNWPWQPRPLAGWKEAFLFVGQAGLKSRQPDVRDEENARLKTMVGDLTLRLEIHRQAEKLRRVNPLTARGGRNDPRGHGRFPFPTCRSDPGLRRTGDRTVYRLCPAGATTPDRISRSTGAPSPHAGLHPVVCFRQRCLI